MAKKEVAGEGNGLIEKTDHFETLVKTFESFRYKHDVSNVFQDWIELFAIEISNSVDIENKERRNEKYRRIMESYDQEEFERFGNMMGALILLLEKDPDDYLGKLYMQLGLYNSFRGQYFTPIFLADLTARMQIGDVERLIKRQGYVTANDPAAGSGVMMIAFYKLLKVRGYNPQKVLRVAVQDVDSKAVHMAYIQLSLMGLNATVIHGDTLSLKERDVWRSPGCFLGWGCGEVEVKNLGKELENTKVTNELFAENKKPTQLSLF